MKRIIALVLLALLFAGPASAEKVVQITVDGILVDNDPEKLSLAVAYKVVRTGESAIYAVPEVFILDAKTGLGAYKTADALNQEVIDGVLADMQSTYSLPVNDIDHIFFQSPFSDI